MSIQALNRLVAFEIIFIVSYYYNLNKKLIYNKFLILQYQKIKIKNVKSIRPEINMSNFSY